MGYKRKGRYLKITKIIPIVICISILLVIIITQSSVIYYKSKINITGLDNMGDNENYSEHYAFIAEDAQSPFWNHVYEGAKEKGESLNIYVERFGSNLPLTYTTSELLKMAIVSNVDGIIIQANGDKDTLELINVAEESGIAVTTVLEDSPQSKRICFVGVNNYQLGREYGNQVLEVATDKTKSVMVLLDSNNNDLSPDIILSGINDTLAESNIEVLVTTIDRKSAFSSEEAVHNIILNSQNVPDILICLNSTDTICAYQTVVDYNKVGKINIIGYYNSQNISQAIEKEIIYSTIVINTKEMGGYAVEALYEYSNTKRVSEYISVDMELISLKNIKKEGE